jgi:hypothetical protein
LGHVHRIPESLKYGKTFDPMEGFSVVIYVRSLSMPDEMISVHKQSFT